MPLPHRFTVGAFRWLFHAAALFSLLLCVSVVTMWIRSYWVCDHPTHWGRAHADPNQLGYVIGFYSIKGHIMIIATDWERTVIRGGTYPPQRGWEFRTLPLDRAPQGSSAGNRTQYVNLVGIVFQSRHARNPNDRTGFNAPGWYADFPYWLLVLLTAVAPGSWLAYSLRLRRRRIRILKNQCPACGYDLRAGHTKCPECGAPVPRKSQATPDTV
jgi:hypothetical protein